MHDVRLPDAKLADAKLADAKSADARLPDARLSVTRDNAIAVVTFNRPERRNAFDLSMWRALGVVMQQLSADEDLRCVVLRGAGEKAFSAGADIAAFEVERGTDEREAEYAHVLDESMQSIRLCQHPVVAMIMGHCLGGGAGIATMCDFRVGGEGMRMGITAQPWGLVSICGNRSDRDAGGDGRCLRNADRRADF